MFGIGFNELLVIAILGVIFISPKDLPIVMNKLGLIMAKIRRFTHSFNYQINSYIDKVELEEEIEESINEDSE